ncbi:FAD-dependent monooxygenase [Kribbella qitaiheensis]|uniref:FAD-dependent monooxygenase n=1 Tax=Kribbella qitaiheensis TaxID=1544730 RepID=UPI001FE5F5E1|nr:FAD-dependent monooxygenase [Kribbella qitaiheensis]
MKNKRILISGASVAGPALAHWLGRYGYEVTVVELAPALRQGGYAVDFRGSVNQVVLERMGILDELRARQTGGSAMRFVDETGRQLMRLPGEFAGGDLEVLRSDLSQVLYDHSRQRAEYVFGDSIASLDEHAAGVDVTFEKGAARTFDLVIGADGLHSVVRRLAFGPEQDYVRYLGYHIAGWDVPNEYGGEQDGLMYNVPGRLASVGPDRRDPSRGRDDVHLQVARAPLRAAGSRAAEGDSARRLCGSRLAHPAVAGRARRHEGDVLRFDQPRRCGPLVNGPDRAAR